MTVREQLSRELEQVSESLVEEILDFCLFVKQRQQSRISDRAIALKEQLDASIKVSESNSNAVLISEDEWRSIQETIYLLSIPKMRESIVEGLSTSINDCSETLEW